MSAQERAELERRPSYRYRCPKCGKPYGWQPTPALARKDEAAHEGECRGKRGPIAWSPRIRIR